MNSYIQKLLFEQNSDRINILLENNIITLEEITNETIKINKFNIIFYVATKISGVDVFLLAQSVIKNTGFMNIIEFAKNVDVSLDKLTDIVCETNNASKIYNFANEFSYKLTQQSIDKLTDAIIKTKCSEKIVYFAQSVKNASINLLAKTIIELENAESMYYFAKNVKNAPIEKLAIAISKTESIDNIYIFAKEFSKVLQPKTMDLLTSSIIKSKRIPDIIKFAKDVPNAPINKLTTAVIKLENPFAIYEFAKAIQDIPNAPINTLAGAIINLSNNLYISRFIGIKGAPVVLLTDILIKHKAYNSLISIPEINKNPSIDKIVKAIIETSNPKLIYELALVVDIKYLNSLAQSIIDLKNMEYALKFIRDFNNDLNPNILSTLEEIVNVNNDLENDKKEEINKYEMIKIDGLFRIIDSKNKEQLKKYRDEIRNLLLEEPQKIKSLK